VIDSVAKIVKVGADDYQGMIVGFLVVLAVAFNELGGGRGKAKQFFPGVLGAMAIAILAILAGVIATIMAGRNTGATVVLASLVGFGLIAIVQGRAAARRPTSPDE